MKYIVYEINNITKKFNVFYESNSKTECKDAIKNKINYNNFYILLKIFNKNNITVQTIIYSFYNDKLKKSLLLNDENYKYYLDMTGEILFSKEFLEKKPWTNKYLDKIISKIVTRKVIMLKGIRMKYNVDFI